jgi:pimeloyl-ACP methyl ester carboxylesterase
VSRRALLWLIGVPTTIVGLVGAALAGPMWEAGGPDIVGFELAFTEGRAGDILAEWDDAARDAARLSLWLDFLFLAGYGAFWSLAAAAMRDRARDALRPRLAAARRVAVVAAPAAAACDAVENVALLLVLGGHGGAAAPPVAGAFALVKFVLISFSVGYVVVALAWRHRRIAAALAALALASVVVVIVHEERRTEDGAAPHVVAEGPASGEPILLIHGYTADHHWWDRVTPALAREHRVVRVDLRGHGRSEKPRAGYSMQEQADLVAEGARRAGVREATVVGHSMGGVVAVSVAERHPDLVARLMLIGTGPDVGNEGRRISAISPAFWPVTGHLVRAFTPDVRIRAELEKGMLPEVDLSPEMAQATDRLTWSAWRGSATAIADFTAAAPLDERVRRTRKPLVALFGAGDDQAERSDRYRRIPGARVVELPGLGHSPQLERPGLTARLIADFARLG